MAEKYRTQGGNPDRSNWAIADMWATQHKHTAQTSNGNFWFQGDHIYSYRTCVACFHNLRAVALVTTNRYSVTTSGKHIRPIQSALRHHFVTTHDVPDVLLHRGHGENMSAFKDRFLEACASIAKTGGHRALYPYQLEAPRTVYAEMVRYCVTFQLDLPYGENHVERSIQAALTKHGQATMRYNDPKAVRRRERAAAFRNFKKLVGI